MSEEVQEPKFPVKCTIKRIDGDSGGGGMTVLLIGKSPFKDHRAIKVTSLPSYSKNVGFVVLVQKSEILNSFDVVHVKKCFSLNEKPKLSKEGIYYKLLCWFSDMYLTSILPHQKATPDVHQNVTVLWKDLWNSVTKTPEKLVFCPHSYDCYLSGKRKAGHLRAFSQRDGFWGLEDLKAAVREYRSKEAQESIDWKVVESALNLFHKFCMFRQFYGNYYLAIDKDTPQDAVDYLVENGYMTYPTFYTDGELLTRTCITDKYHDEHIENDFVRLLKARNLEILIYSCSFYDEPVFGSKLIDLITANIEKYGKAHVLCVIGNRTCLVHVKTMVGQLIEFFVIDDVVDPIASTGSSRKRAASGDSRNGMPDFSNVKVIILDRATRVGPLLLGRLLKKCPNCLRLCMVGDGEENWTPPRRGGGGSLFDELEEVAKTEVWSSLDDRRRICLAYRELENGCLQGVRRLVYSDSDEAKVLDKIYKDSIEDGKLGSYYVVCSSRPECDNLMRKTRCKMSIGTNVYAERYDFHGRITWASRPQGARGIYELKHRDQIEPWIPHHVRIGTPPDSVTMLSSAQTLHNATILPIECLCVPPRDYVYFIVSKKTHGAQLKAAVKFAKKDLIIVHPASLSANDLFDIVLKKRPFFDKKTLIKQKLRF